MPEDKSLTMYDFYVLDYLKSILDWPSKNFRDLPEDLIDSVNNAVKNLYPALRQELLDAVFYAVCAEIRYAENVNRRDHNRRIAKSNSKFEKLYKLWAKYRNFHGKSLSQREELTDIYDIRKPSSKSRVPESEKDNREERNLSYKAANYAIENSGYSRADFMEMCEELYHNGSWDNSYGGTAWGNICKGWLELNSADKIDPNVKEVKEVDYDAGLKNKDGKEIKTTKKSESKSTKTAKKPMSVAIDHIYDLQHNTDTVFNKLKSYYKGGYGWIKTALDDKANVESYHSLLNKASGTVKSMALPILYNKLGQTWEKEMKIQKPVDTHPQVTSMGDALTQSIDDVDVGDCFQPSNNLESYRIITGVEKDYLYYDLYKKHKVINTGFVITKIALESLLNDGTWKKIPDPLLTKTTTQQANPSNSKYMYKKGDKVEFVDIGDGAYENFVAGEIYVVDEDSDSDVYVSIINSEGVPTVMFTTRVKLVKSKNNRSNSIILRFKVGDIVKCIDDNNIPQGSALTMGKKYKVTSFSDNTVAVLDDNGHEKWFRNDRFEPSVRIDNPNYTPKFNVGDWIMVKGMLDDYPGKIIKYDPSNRKPYLVKYQDPSSEDEWIREDNIYPDNQI